MGSSSSSLVKLRIHIENILYIAGNKIVIGKDDKEPYTLFFDDDIKDKCYSLFIKPGPLYIDIHHYQQIIVVVTNPSTHKSYASSKVSPTTFGWSLVQS